MQTDSKNCDKSVTANTIGEHKVWEFYDDDGVKYVASGFTNSDKIIDKIPNASLTSCVSYSEKLFLVHYTCDKEEELKRIEKLDKDCPMHEYKRRTVKYTNTVFKLSDEGKMLTTSIPTDCCYLPRLNVYKPNGAGWVVDTLTGEKRFDFDFDGDLNYCVDDNVIVGVSENDLKIHQLSSVDDDVFGLYCSEKITSEPYNVIGVTRGMFMVTYKNIECEVAAADRYGHPMGSHFVCDIFDSSSLKLMKRVVFNTGHLTYDDIFDHVETYGARQLNYKFDRNTLTFKICDESTRQIIFPAKE